MRFKVGAYNMLVNKIDMLGAVRHKTGMLDRIN